MTGLLFVAMIVCFLVLDVAVRAAGRRVAERRLRAEREAVLDTALRLDFTHEAPSLKRVDVPQPRARILVVDDEPVVLDSFRRILVLAGFSVDTVETGPEALGLLQRTDYDVLFTDLKMPGMDGIEVVKAARHLRPDVDVAVVTGFGTIETAVETMQHGAVDYVQKPFTPEELTRFARTILIKRQARLDAQRLPSVRVVAPAAAEDAAPSEWCVPGGAFLSPVHVWARIEPGGAVRLGLDDFARKALGEVDRIVLPEAGRAVRRGDPLFSIHQAGRALVFPSPLSGQIVRINPALEGEPSRMKQSPYDRGWACLLQPKELAGELKDLRIGRPAVDWYQEEITRLRSLPGAPAPIDWDAFEHEFLGAAALTG